MNLGWLGFSGPLFILSYRQLRTAPVPCLVKLAEFLRIPATPEQVDCAAGGQGGFHREKDGQQEAAARALLGPDLLLLAANYTQQVLAAANIIDPFFQL